jgi:hypothetical protein
MDMVFVFVIEDSEDVAWEAELAVVARNRQEAHHRLRQRGVRRRQFHHEGRPVREMGLEECGAWLTDPSLVWRRLSEWTWGSDSPDEGWEPVPETVPLDWRKRR